MSTNNDCNLILVGVTGSGTTIPRSSSSTITTATIVGETTGSSAASGKIGYLDRIQVASGSAQSLTSGVVKDIISVTPISNGVYIMWGNVYVTASGANLSSVISWAAQSAGTQPASDYGEYKTTLNKFQTISIAVPYTNVQSSGADVFLSVLATFATGTATACGVLYVRAYH